MRLQTSTGFNSYRTWFKKSTVDIRMLSVPGVSEEKRRRRFSALRWGTIEILSSISEEFHFKSTNFATINIFSAYLADNASFHIVIGFRCGGFFAGAKRCTIERSQRRRRWRCCRCNSRHDCCRCHDCRAWH